MNGTWVKRGALLTATAAVAVLGGGAVGGRAAAGAVFTVTTNADSGAGSLRQAISDANTTAGADTIEFSIGSGAVTINVTSSFLPSITEPVTIDGTTQPGFSGVPLVRLKNGTGNPNFSGLDIPAGSSVVRGLVITGFNDAITLRGSGGGNTVAGNLLGMLANGTAAPNNFGVAIRSSANNVVGGVTAGDRNVLSGNVGPGVHIDGNSNTVEGNYIGTDRSGTVAVPNNTGVVISSNSTGNTIGGTTAAARNVVSGNSLGVDLFGSGDTGNTVEGNYIGTDKSGLAALGNGAGVHIASQATSNLIGGTGGGSRNLISGNGNGVEIVDAGTNGNVVAGNYIGTDKTGAAAVPNTGRGVSIFFGASSNTVGGTDPGAGNVISGNGFSGVGVSGSGTNANVIQANLIGTDATGTAALGNSPAGVLVEGNATNTLVGGAFPAARNVISGNVEYGIQIAGATDTTVEGDFIGTDVNGTAALGNGIAGVAVANESNHNTIGSPTSATRNIISGNGQAGVFLTGSGSSYNDVDANFIGTNVDGTAKVPNGVGILVGDAASRNTFAVNVISGNTGDGVQIGFAVGTIAAGNKIGTKANGTGKLGNGANGVELLSTGSGTQVGGPSSSWRNVIQFNGGAGVLVDTSTGNPILRNSIFANAGLGISLVNNGNNLQPSPTITSVVTGADTKIDGTLSGSAPSKKFRIDAFRSPSCDPSGAGEGKKFVGAATVTTDGSGNANWTLTVKAIAAGQQITATATNQSSKNTSAFSGCFPS
jgi:hypothetical protein